MTKRVLILLTSALFALSPTVGAMDPDHPTGREKGEEQETKQLYTCVMHPEVVRAEPGKCPKCGMTLVPLKQAGAHLTHNADGMEMPSSSSTNHTEHESNYTGYSC